MFNLTKKITDLLYKKSLQITDGGQSQEEFSTKVCSLVGKHGIEYDTIIVEYAQKLKYSSDFVLLEALLNFVKAIQSIVGVFENIVDAIALRVAVYKVQLHLEFVDKKEYCLRLLKFNK